MKELNKIINLAIAGITFVISFIIYLVTMAPTTSFWDCGEFIATSVTMGVPHPPGTPLYLLLGNIFSQIPLFDDIGARVNIISVIVSALSVMFVYLISVQIVEEWRKSSKSITNQIINYGSAFIGAMTFAVTDSQWFNAVEAEVYSLSTFFTAIVVWLILKWSREHNNPGNYRYILMIAYIIGLATAVHLLNLLALPFIALIIYFKKYESHPLGIVGSLLALVLMIFVCFIMIKNPVLMLWLSPFLIFGVIAIFTSFEIKYTGITIATICSLGILMAIYIGIIKGVPNLIDQLYNRIPYFGLPSNSGQEIMVFLWDAISKLYLPLSLLLFFIIGAILLITKKRKSQLLKITIASILMVYIGFSTYSIIFIRASQEPRINENSPNTLKEFISYMNRDQYGQWSILDRASTLKRDENQYWNRYTHDKSNPSKEEVRGFVWNYQIKEMYLRYFGWQFIGKEDWDNKSLEVKTLDGQLIKKKQDIDAWRYFLPLAFIFGLVGIVYHFYSDYRRALALLSLFLATGLLIVVYLNQYDPQPRERDYSYVGSFFVFSIWISVGVNGFLEWIKTVLSKNKNVISEKTQHITYGGIIGILFISMPLLMFIKDFDEHNRKGNYVAWDYAYNLLNSCKPNGILFTNGDNDTFPLWYLQEVEDIRKDVRVVNLSLLNTPWYIEQLKNQEPKINLNLDKWIVNKDWIIDQKYKLIDGAGCKNPAALNYNSEALYYCDAGIEDSIPRNLKYDLGEKYDDVNNNANWDDGEPFYDENDNGKYDKRYNRIDYRYKCCQELDPITGTGHALKEWSSSIWEQIEYQGTLIFTEQYEDYKLPKSENYDVKEHGIPFPWSPAPVTLNLYGKNIEFELNPTISNYLKVQDVMVMQILENAENNRPVYFAVTVAPSNRLGLENYLDMQGLVYEITNTPTNSINPTTHPRINFDKMARNISQPNTELKIQTASDYENYIEDEKNHGIYRYTNLNNPNVYFPHHIIRLVGNYRSGFLQLVIEKLEENQILAQKINEQNYLNIKKELDENNITITTLLDQMNTYFPNETIPIDPPVNIQIATFYTMANNPEKAYNILDKIEAKDLNFDDTMMLYKAYTDYLKDYNNGIEILLNLHLESLRNGTNESVLMDGLRSITDLPNSIEIINTFKDQYPEIAEFRYSLAIAYAKKDRINNAIKELKDWLEINPNDQTAIQFIKDLEGLK